MPARLRASVAEVLGEPQALHLEFDRARVVTTAPGNRLWVVPGRGVICTFKTGPVAAACATRGQAIQHGLVLGTYAIAEQTHQPTSYLALGLVPNGVTSVEVRIGNALKRIVVEHNVFGIESDGPAQLMGMNRHDRR